MIEKNMEDDIFIDVLNGLYIDEDDCKWWYLHNKLHRLDGPAVVLSNGNIIWYKHDKRHRIDGPAIEFINGDIEWWLYDEQYTEEEYNKLISNIPLLFWNRFKKGEWL